MTITKFIFQLVFFGFIFLFLISSCSYEKTTFDIGSLFDPTWDFSKTSELTFDENYVEIKDGKAQLKILDLKHEGEDFHNGSYVGSALFSNKLQLLRDENSIDLRQILPDKIDNQIGYWRFNGNFSDSSGNNNHLIPFEVTANGSPVVVGNSAVFDGIDDNANIPTQFIIPLNSAITVSFWNYVTTADIQSSSSFDFGGFANPDKFQSHTPFSDGYLYWDFGHAGGNGRLSVDYTPYLDKWTHVLLVSEGNGGTFKGVYLDGSLVASGLVSDGPTIEIAGGNIGSRTATFHKGKIDEFSVWTEALNIAEVQKIYHAQKASFIELSPLWTPKWDNIVGYWKMDSNWQDYSGNLQHGTGFNGIVFDDTDLKVGTASGLFDGVDDLVRVTHDPSQNLESFSIAHWVKKEGVVPNGHSYGVLVSKGDGTSSGNNRNYSTRVYELSGRASLTIGSGVATGNCNSLSDISGTWHYFVGTAQVQGADTIIKIYIDGALESTCTFVGGTAYQLANGPITFGVWETGSVYGRFPGKIDDVSLWDQVLSPSEISLIYNRQKQKYAGHYDSEVINLGSSTSNWPDLSWSTNLPFGKELVGDFNNDGIPDSESSTDYSLISENLNSNIVGYWNFSEAVFDSAPSGLDFNDLSGNQLHGLGFGDIELLQPGKINKSIYVDGVNDYITFADTPALNFNTNDNFTISLWLKVPIQQTDLTTYNNSILEKYSSRYPFAIRVHNQTSGTPGRLAFSRYDGSLATSVHSANPINDNIWHHTLFIKNGANLSTYVDGILSNTTTDNSVSSTINTAEMSLGSRLGSYDFEGQIDDFAIWGRALSTLEIQQLYRRGANRIKFQVKSCLDSSCECKSLSTLPLGNITDCDGDAIINSLDFDDIHKAEFIGPGGDSSTFYSELFNRKATELTFNCGLNTSDSNSNVCLNDEITITAGPIPTAPFIDYSYFPLEARPDANPYFQYRVYMEADENTACSGSPCLPELTSVNLNPSGVNKYFGALLEVKPSNPISYKSIKSATITADSCVTYQLSPDGTNYYYWNLSSWTPVTLASHRTTKLEVENNIIDFSTQFGPGSLYIKAFLQTNTNQSSNCSIRSIDIKYNQE